MVAIITNSFYNCVSGELKKREEKPDYEINLEEIAKNCGKTVNSRNLITEDIEKLAKLAIRERELDLELRRLVSSDACIEEIEQIRNKYRKIGLDIGEETIKEYEWYESWMHKDVAKSSS